MHKTQIIFISTYGRLTDEFFLNTSYNRDRENPFSFWNSFYNARDIGFKNFVLVMCIIDIQLFFTQ